MAYDWRDYESEMERYDARLRSRGVSAEAYRGFAVVQTPLLGFDRFVVDRANRAIVCGSLTYVRWRLDVAAARIDARADLDRLLAAAWKRCGVDEPTGSK